MWMVIIMTENGGMTKLMDLDNFIIRTVLFMKENGKRIINMGSAMKDGQIMIVLEAITYKIKNMVKENFNGQMALSTKESLLKIICKALGYILGLMGEFTKENGKIINYTAKAEMYSQIRGFMKATIYMIRKVGMESIHGLMGEFIKGNG